MTTQSAVTEAFFDGEDEPNRASNFAIREGANDGTYLCGGVDGEEVVLAKRVPIRQFEVYRGYRALRYSRLGNGATRRQQHHVVRVARRIESQSGYMVAIRRDDDARPEPEEVLA